METFRTEVPELAAVLDGASHVDVKSVESELALREFVAGALGFRRWWVTALFGVRVVFAWLLRLEKTGPPSSSRRSLRPDQSPFVPGAAVSFFTVAAAQDDEFLLLAASDKHLTGYLAFAIEPARDAARGTASAARRRVHLVTVVRYHRWTGPLYFAVIRPFHHLVVGSMARAGARGVPPSSMASGPEPEQPPADSGQEFATAGPVE